MVKFIRQQELDEDAWNQCVKKHGQGRPFLFTWYLDTVCERWNALVYEDYEWIMPLPSYKPFGVEYCVTPPWVYAMFPIGPQAHNPEKQAEMCALFREHWPAEIKYTRLPGLQGDSEKGGRQKLFWWQCGPESLALRADEHLLADNEDYTLFKNDPPEALIELMFRERTERHPFDRHARERLKHLMHVGIYKRRGQVWSLYDRSNTLSAGAYMLYDAECITIVTLAGRNEKDRREERRLLWHILKEAEPYSVRVEWYGSAEGHDLVNALYPDVKLIPEFYLNRLPWHLNWYRPEV